ncbi:ABC transporter ATP-binding protein [Cytobacillus oceanisediminis]|uniref:ABC transporter ATP-binding protein n=1 Tax=Cytobacillus oceanisediminis TaxID=665099 RepID=A0ABX3CKC8_9BACI|nr:ABC transporter ATP-binding protein [Cytobacillus oceanisediminis]OHX40704.1 hypothetical protein BBV17_29065 [Cytobacillus oceanisediminis]
MKYFEKKEEGLFKIYIWALSFYKPYMGRTVLLILFGFLISISELMVPKLFEYFIDNVLQNRNEMLFLYILIVFFFILLIKLFSTASLEYVQRYVQENISRDIQWSLIKKLRTLGIEFTENQPTGRTLSLLNTEVAALQNLYRNYFPEMVQTTIFVVFAILLMINISITLSICVIPCFALYYLAGPRIERKASKIAKKLSDSTVYLGQYYYETVSSIRELVAYNGFMWNTERVLGEVKKNVNLYSSRYLYAYLRGAVRRLTYYLGAVILFIYGSYLIKQGSISTGEYVSFILLYFSTMNKLTYVITLLTEQKLLMFQAKKIYNFYSLSPRIKEDKDPISFMSTKGGVNIKNVSFSYQSSHLILNNINLRINPGEKIALVGESGCGKSTLAKLIGRFYDVEDGKITIDGVDIKKLSFDTLRRSIGFSFQSVYLFGSSIRENIMFVNPTASEEEMIQASKAAHLHDFIVTLPNGYDTFVGEKGTRLSGGQRQRLGLARLFLMNPSIVILDEPTSALDNISEKLIQGSLEQFLKNKTTITIAHRLSTIRNYDQIVVISKGIIKERGTHCELMAKDGIYRNMVENMEEVKVKAL